MVRSCISLFNAGETSAANEVAVTAEPDWEDEDFIFKGMTLVGVAGIEDPVRPEVSDPKLAI